MSCEVITLIKMLFKSSSDVEMEGADMNELTLNITDVNLHNHIVADTHLHSQMHLPSLHFNVF